MGAIPLYNKTTSQGQMLPPLVDLEFHANIHRYRYRGNWLRYSVSRIAQPTTPEQRMRFEETRHVWEPRGNYVHTAAEALLLGLDPEEGDYGPWIDALRSCWLLQGAETMATEFGVVIPHHEVAGTFDGLIKTSDGAVVLLDFKTVQTDKAVDARKPATAQLGGYLHGLNINKPLIDVDKCCTVVIGPGRSKVISEDPDACFAAWEDRLSIHKIMTELPF
jgi:hypothetical protein